MRWCLRGSQHASSSRSCAVGAGVSKQRAGIYPMHTTIGHRHSGCCGESSERCYTTPPTLEIELISVIISCSHPHNNNRPPHISHSSHLRQCQLSTRIDIGVCVRAPKARELKPKEASPAGSNRAKQQQQRATYSLSKD